MACWTFFACASAKVCHLYPSIISIFNIFLENDTLARIGTSCLQQLLENNVAKLSAARWERVTTTFVRLFRTTTPYQLFDENLRVEIDNTPEPVEQSNGGKFSVCNYGINAT